MSASGRGERSSTRVVTYRYEVPGGFDESVVEPVIERAREAGVVTEYDTGRGQVVWFQGAPGDGLRALRERVLELLGPRARAVVVSERRTR